MTKNKAHILILTPGFPKDENDFICIPPLQEFLVKFKTSYPLAKISVIAFQYPYRSRRIMYGMGLTLLSLNGAKFDNKKTISMVKSIF